MARRVKAVRTRRAALRRTTRGARVRKRRPTSLRTPRTHPGAARYLERHKGLIHGIARKYARLNPSTTVEDLTQEGNLGLLQALRRFKGKKGVKLSTFAHPHIEGRIRRAALRSTTIAPSDKAFWRSVKQGTAHKPKAIKAAKAERLLYNPGSRLVSRYHELATDGGIAQAHARASLSRLVKTLPKLEAEVIHRRFFNGQMTVRGIAKKLKRSPATVDALQKRALARLRARSMGSGR